ncbi:hypothetical protein KEH51_13695 [[Brevibacterium] frigoritolerans]|uniref:Uncharacterized protein n=1 Tax=Peribacillus frigoritolerans TaxID=450367 RepID=A0A941FIR0_9BACI|nr:hypothetical protein [Peribacillus frigoritolerans]
MNIPKITNSGETILPNGYKIKAHYIKEEIPVLREIILLFFLNQLFSFRLQSEPGMKANGWPSRD